MGIVAPPIHGVHAFGGQGASRHSEISANLLIGLRSNFRIFSECALIKHANHLDFDSAIPRFESRRPSQIKILKKKCYLAALPGQFLPFRNSLEDLSAALRDPRLSRSERIGR